MELIRKVVYWDMIYLRMIFSLLFLIACHSEPSVPQPTSVPTGTATEKPIETPRVNWKSSEILNDDNPEPIPDQMIMVFVSNNDVTSNQFGSIFSNFEMIYNLNKYFYSIFLQAEDHRDYENYQELLEMAPAMMIFHGRDVPAKDTGQDYEILFISDQHEPELILQIMTRLSQELEISGYISTSDAIKIAEEVKEQYENNSENY